mgnify:CR=1 FL=1
MSELIEPPRTALAVLPATAISTIVAADTDGILAEIARKVNAFKPDVSTVKGRDAMRSLAAEIASSKVALVKIGKGLTEEWRKQTAAVNAECNIVEERMNELREKVRAPLTAWEREEKDRVAGHEAAIKAIIDLGDFGGSFIDPPLVDVIARLDQVENLPERDWKEFSTRALDAKVATIQKLARMRDEIGRREAEQAELKRFREAEAERARIEAERLQAEADRRREAEIAEQARLKAEAEAQRLMAEEKQRAAQAAEEAAEKARLEIEQEQERAAQAKRDAEEAEARAAKAEQDRLQAIAQAEKDRLAAIEAAEMQRRADADRAEHMRVEAAAKAERDRLAAIETERARVAEEKRQADEAAAKRKADNEHRGKILGEAKDALIAHAEVDEATARRVLLAIGKGLVPHVGVTF